MRILVIGGAGYIGSHMVKLLCRSGYTVTTFDNLSTGHRDAISTGNFVYADLDSQDSLHRVFRGSGYDVVMHFASSTQVAESVVAPSKYYANVTNTHNLLNTMVEHGVKYLVFSSTAAIFGEPQYTPIDEEHPKCPLNPYGQTKWMVEQMLADYDRAYDLKSVSLRYFNAAGTDPEGQLGERHFPETHLVPLVLQAASGRREAITLFGTDYATPDGTCIRDYIHVNDLCAAHLLALKKLVNDEQSTAYNLGNGNGFSVKELIDTAQMVTERQIKVISGQRRAGDPERLIADSSRIREELHWEPQYPDLATMIEHAWRWEQKHKWLVNCAEKNV